MERDIITKLRAHLQQPIDTECKAIYLLCQLRKLGEGKPLPLSLQMCFNCALHVDLERNAGANDFLLKLDDFIDRFFQTRAIPDTEHLEEFLFIGSFRKELKENLLLHGLPTDLCDDGKSWNKFIEVYAGVIEDGSITPSPKVKLNHVVKAVFTKGMRFSNPNLSSRIDLPFLIDWEIELNPLYPKKLLKLSACSSEAENSIAWLYRY